MQLFPYCSLKYIVLFMLFSICNKNDYLFHKCKYYDHNLSFSSGKYCVKISFLIANSL